MITSTLFAVPFTAKALDSSGQIGDDVYYNFNSTTGEVIVFGTGNTYNYGTDSPFRHSNDVKSVVIEDGVTGIGDYLFYCCPSLTSVTLSNTVKTIGNWTFWGSPIDHPVIPSSVESIGDVAFDSAVVEVRSFNCNLALTAFYYVTEIKACEGSTAQTYAQNNNKTFTSIGHVEVNGEAIEPTCTEKGHTAGMKCSVCGEWFSGEEIPATGHVEEAVAAAEPTATEPGHTAGTVCSVCGTVMSGMEETTAVAHVESSSNDLYFDDIETAIANWTDGTTLTLLDDVIISSETTISGSLTLDLNGHGMTRTASGRFFTIPADSLLTINDSDNSTTHKFSPSGDIAVFDETNGTITVNGGYITGGNTDAGAVAALLGGTLIINGGTYIGNVSTGTGNASGGGVANLQENYTSTVTVNGGTMMYNSACNWGGAIYLMNNSGTVNLNGGTFTNNVCNSNNSGTGNGGAVQVSSGNTLNVSGNLVIKDNVKYSSGEKVANNLFINSVKLSVTDTLANDAEIGVTLANLSVFSKSANTSLNNPAKFFSDDTNKAIDIDSSGQLIACTVDGKIGEHVYYTWNRTSGEVIVFGTGNTYDYSSDSPFYNSNDVKSVVIEDGVTGIGDTLFLGCNYLTSVTLSNTVKTIGMRSFVTSPIDYLVIPSSVESIASLAFFYPIVVEVRSYNCNLDNSAFHSLTEIKACEGSTAQAYAQINNMTFTSIGHTHDENDSGTVTEPTCTQEGARTYTCTVCGEIYTAELIPANGHSYDSGTVTTEPTCTQEGTRTYTCTVCRETYTESIPANGHSYESVVTAPSAKSEGYTTYTCSVCGDSYIADYVPPTTADGKIGEHVYYTWNSTTGEVIVFGTGNTYDYDDNSPFRNSLNVKSVVIENGVTGIGDTLFLGCNHLTSVTLSNTVKTIGKWSFSQSPIDYLVIPSSVESIAYCAFFNASVVEVRSYNCNLDDYAFSNATEIKACEGSTAQAYAQMYNRMYNQSYEKTFTSIGHWHNKNDSGTVVTEQTCGDNGVRTFTCSVCGESYIEFIPATNEHTWETICINNEYHCRSCTVCGTLRYLAPHTYESEVTTEPSCTAEGVRTYTCSGCGDSYTEAIAKTNHVDNNNDGCCDVCGANIGGGSGGGQHDFDEPDFDAYDAVYEKKNSFNEDDYSAESYAALMELYDEYEDLEDGVASQAYIDFVVSEILTAISELVPYLNVKLSAENGTATINSQNLDKTSLLQGESVTLNATANQGYVFKEWYEIDTKRTLSNNSEFTFVLSSNMNIKAVFVKENSATLTFANESGQVVKTIDYAVSVWSNVESLNPLLPEVPYSLGRADGHWAYDEANVLALLANGEDVTIMPIYDSGETPSPVIPTAYDVPVINLTYSLNDSDENNNVASFIMAVGIPEGIEIKEMGTALYYKKAASFDPTQYELVLNQNVLTSKFSDNASGIYITNMKKFTSKYNWAVRGYVTYYDAQGNLKTAYSNQINIVNKQQV